jgi:peptidyl-prolyl cis-trans isomerase D
LRVDGVTPAALPPLESIKDAVLADWRKETIAAKLKEIAGDLVKKGNGGKSLTEIGSALEMAPLKSPPMGRAEQSEVFSGQFIHDMFEAKVGRFFSGPVGKGQSLIVARLDSVTTVNEPNEVQIEPVFNDRLRQVYGSDVAEIFSKTAQKELNAQVNEKQFQAATEQN